MIITDDSNLQLIKFNAFHCILVFVEFLVNNFRNLLLEYFRITQNKIC